MEKVYNFDCHKKIDKLINEKRFKEAIIAYQSYFKTYPNDFFGYILYSSVLIKTTQLNEAERILEIVRESLAKDPLGKNHDEYIKMKTYLLSCQKKYEACLDSLLQNQEMFRKHNWNVINLLLFLKMKLGLLEAKDYCQNNYKLKQVVSYNTQSAMEHIKQTHQNILEDSERSQFSDGINIENLYYYLKNSLPENPTYFETEITSSYIFQYIASGHSNQKLVDYIKVTTLSDSNNILTMFPYDNKEREIAIDINIDDGSRKLKRISQIEKFNQKYKK